MAARKKSNRKRAARKPAARRKSGRKKGSKRTRSAKKAGKKKSAKRKSAPKRGSKKAAGKRKSAPKRKSARKAAGKKAATSPPPSAPAAGGVAAAEVRPFRPERPPAPPQPSPGVGSGSTGMGGTRPSGAGTAPGFPSPLGQPGDVSDSEPRRIGVVTHYYEHAGACVVSLDAGELRVGDTIHVRGHTTDFYQRVERMERDHVPIASARGGEEVGVQVSQRVRSHDAVYCLGRS